MTENDLWKIHPRMPRKVRPSATSPSGTGFSTSRSSFRPAAKIYYARGDWSSPGAVKSRSPTWAIAFLMPQFSDAEDVLAHCTQRDFPQALREAAGIKVEDITFTAITIRESAVDHSD